MRIVGGEFRSVALTPVGKGDAGAHLRPTTDRVRESLFNVLSTKGLLEGARVLDLFAGTGALGLEAVSRGADHAAFVDNGRAAHRLIAANISKLRVQSRTTVLRRDVLRLGACDQAPFDLVFLDPPYGKGLVPQAVDVLVKGDWLSPEAVIVCEDSAAIAPPDGFDSLDQRTYGDTYVTVISRKAL